MMLDYSFASSLTAIFLAGAVVAAHWRLRLRSAREQALLREALEALGADCRARFATCDAAHAAAEASLASAGSVLAQGRLSTSRRADAFRLLRSGASAESAAKTLGIAHVEMRLLASVYAILTSE